MMIQSAVVKRATFLAALLTAGLLFAGACQSVAVVQAVASDPTTSVEASATTAELVTAWAAVALATIAFLGLGGTLLLLRQERDRQRLEVEAYIRIDIGPRKGTKDFPALKDEAYEETKHVTLMGNATEQDPLISVWFTNRQKHHLGIALGFGAEIVTEFTSPEGKSYTLIQSPRLAYIEPEKIIRVDLVRFPADWTAESRLTGSEHRSIYGSSRPTRHGRWECNYKDGQFTSIPVSDPPNLLHDRLFKALQFIRREPTR